MNRSHVLLLALLVAGCAAHTAPVAKPLPKDAAQISTDQLSDMVAQPAPAAVKVPARPFVAQPSLKVVALPVPNKPVVSLRFVFEAGSVDDPPGKEGLTHLTTQLMVEGGTQELSASELLEALFPMAAELSSENDKELTVLVGRVHQEKLARFLTIFTDVMLHPRFDPKEFERLRTEQLNAITTRLRGENDEELGKAGLDALLYSGHPYRHPVIGTEKGVTSITLDDVRAQWRRVFTQDRLIIGLAGAVDDKLQKKVLGLMSALPATGGPRQPIPDAPGVKGKTLVLQRDTASTAGSFGFSIPLRREDPDFPAVAVALSYFGEHRQEHGVLFQEVRDKRGLNYGTYAYAEHYRQAGFGMAPRPNIARSVQDLTLWLRPVEAKNGVFATRVVLHFLDQLLTKPISADKWNTARGFLTGATRLWAQTDQARLGWAIDDLLYGTPDQLERLRQAAATLTPEQAQAALRKYLSADRLNFVFVTKDADGLVKALKSQAPTPISYPTPKPQEVLDEDVAIAKQPLPTHPALIKVEDAATFMRE